jgi:AraC-like DNA-binding protein
MGYKNGLAVSWPVDALKGVECLRATAMRHHYGRHWHNAYAIGVIESGVGGNRCRGTDYYNRAGSIVVMNPGETHTGYAAGPNPLSYRMFYISIQALLETLPANTPAPRFERLTIFDRRWAHKLLQLHACLESSMDPLEKQERFSTTFGSFSACFSQDVAQIPDGDEPRAVRRVKAYLENNHSQPVTIDSLAQLTQMNRAYLIRTFTKTVGMPPYAFLTQIRVEKAKHYLASGMLPVEAALEVGFADQSHLNRHFKKLTGTSPHLYRSSHYRSRNQAGA